MEAASAGAEDSPHTAEGFFLHDEERLVQLASLLAEDLNRCCRVNLGFEDDWCLLDEKSLPSAEPSPADRLGSPGEPSPADILESPAESSPADRLRSPAESSPADRLGSSAEPSPTDRLGSSAKPSPTDRLGSSAEPSPTDRLGSPAELSPADRPRSRAEPSPADRLGSPAEVSPADSPLIPGELNHAAGGWYPGELRHADRPLIPADWSHADTPLSSAELSHPSRQLLLVGLDRDDTPLTLTELSHDVPSVELRNPNGLFSPAELSRADMPLPSAEYSDADRSVPFEEPSPADRPVASEELSHADMLLPSAELSPFDRPHSAAELRQANRPLFLEETSPADRPHSAAELTHCGAAPEPPAVDGSRESSEEIDWSWLATLEARASDLRTRHDESPRPHSAWLRASMRRVRPFRLSDPPGGSLDNPSTRLGPLATPDTVLDILANNNRRPSSAPGGGGSRVRRDFPRRYSSYTATILNGSAANLTQATEPVAVATPSSDEEDLSSASEGARTSGAEQGTDSGAETVSIGTSTRQNSEPEMQSTPLGTWPHSLSSMLATLGCTLGLFNISRFAILSIHFGATFIVQFLLLTMVIGIPLFTLHTCLGQCLAAGVMDMWHISPIFQGIGVALLVSQALIGIYSIVGVSWMFIYFRDSFITKQDSYRWAEPYDLYREGADMVKNISWKLEETVPDYFNSIVLQRHNVEMPESSFGHVKFQVAFNLAVVWMIVFVSLSKGLKSYGKVVYVFSLFPVFGTLVLSTKLLGLTPTNTSHQVFPQTVWDEFFLNTKCWVAATVEVFFTWGLLGATAMQITSHNRHRHLLNRDTSLVVVLTVAVLLLAAFLANTCVAILHSHGFTYIPSSFEHISTYGFLQPESEPLPPALASTPVRYMTHTVLIAGSRVTVPGIDSRQQSGYQVLRLATELVPSTLALLGADGISPFWAVLFYFVLILFGIAQQLCIWHCVITGIMAINTAALKSWETTITFFSCVCGFILGLPMTTELGIFVVHFLDYAIGSSWWLMVLYLIEILVVFVVRGRPYSGETVVATLFSRSAGCLHAWAAPLLVFTWNVILPIALVVVCIMVFKNGRFRDLYSWRSLTYNYWPVWTREVGCMLQILPILLVPLGCIVQTCRYLSSGPPDILDRIQLLYRPSMTRQDMTETPNCPTNSATSVPAVTTTTAVTPTPEATVSAFEDPPPKYTPPPSYTTATGARIAKLLRQSFRRSMRRLASALGDNSTLPPPPDYSAVLVEMNRTIQEHDEQLPEPSSALSAHMSTMTAANVAHILRSSLRRSAPHNRDIEGLVDRAAPVHHDMMVPSIRPETDSKPEAESTSVI